MLNALLISFILPAATQPTTAPPLPYARIEAAGLEILVDGVLMGSGTLIQDGRVLTAAHIVSEAGRVEVISPHIGRLDAQIEARDRGHDLALLEIPSTPHITPPKLEPRAPLPGEDLFLFGAPQSRHQVLLRGSMGRRTLTYEFYPEEQHYVGVYHISAPSPEGTSGGGWFNREGALVGVQSARLVMEGIPQGIAYMAPADRALELMKAGRDRRAPTLGVGFVEIWEAEDLLNRYPRGARGLIAHVIHEGGPADKAGLERMALITGVDKITVERRDELISYIRGRSPGAEVRLQLLSGQRLRVPLGGL